jgi:hypothetical protein
MIVSSQSTYITNCIHTGNEHLILWFKKTSCRGKSVFFTQQCVDQLWHPHHLLSNGYWGVKLILSSTAEVRTGRAIPLSYMFSRHST